LYYRFAEDGGVGSSLMALKKKGEEEGSMAYQDTCCADNITPQMHIMFMLLVDQKLLIGEE